MGTVGNQSWRVYQLESYRLHLQGLMTMWKRCAAARRSAEAVRAPRMAPRHAWRPIFKLTFAPNHERARSSAERRCTDWGYNNIGPYLAVANAVAREVVEEAGFEVFDPFPAGLHAANSWYNEDGADAQHSDVTSDMVTQMLVSQLCA